MTRYFVRSECNITRNYKNDPEWVQEFENEFDNHKEALAYAKDEAQDWELLTAQLHLSSNPAQYVAKLEGNHFMVYRNNQPFYRYFIRTGKPTPGLKAY